MTTYLSNRDGGKTNEEGHYRFHTKVWDGNVISGLQAVQRSPLALGVDISTGDAKVDYSAGYSYTVWTDAIVAVNLTTANPSNPRIDRIVGYVDRGVTPSSASSNNPGILKFMAVAGTPAGSPTRPNDAAVQSAVGASNPWFQIADVLVGTGVTTVSTGNITDNRVFVTTSKIGAASVTNAMLSTTAGEPGGAWTAWTPTFTNLTIGNGTAVARYIKIGKTVNYRLILTFGTTTSVSGTITYSLPVTASSTAYNTSDSMIGSATFRDVSVPSIFPGDARMASTTTSDLLYKSTSYSGTSATVPFTWTTNDRIAIQGSYEAA